MTTIVAAKHHIESLSDEDVLREFAQTWTDRQQVARAIRKVMLDALEGEDTATLALEAIARECGGPEARYSPGHTLAAVITMHKRVDALAAQLEATPVLTMADRSKLAALQVTEDRARNYAKVAGERDEAIARLSEAERVAAQRLADYKRLSELRDSEVVERDRKDLEHGNAMIDLRGKLSAAKREQDALRERLQSDAAEQCISDVMAILAGDCGMNDTERVAAAMLRFGEEHPSDVEPAEPRDETRLHYEEPDPADEPGIVIDEDQRNSVPFVVELSGETYYDTRADAERAQQEWALAIYRNVARSVGRADKGPPDHRERDVLAQAHALSDAWDDWDGPHDGFDCEEFRLICTCFVELNRRLAVVADDAAVAAAPPDGTREQQCDEHGGPLRDCLDKRHYKPIPNGPPDGTAPERAPWSAMFDSDTAIADALELAADLPSGTWRCFDVLKLACHRLRTGVVPPPDGWTVHDGALWQVNGADCRPPETRAAWVEDRGELRLYLASIFTYGVPVASVLALLGATQPPNGTAPERAPLAKARDALVAAARSFQYIIGLVSPRARHVPHEAASAATHAAVEIDEAIRGVTRPALATFSCQNCGATNHLQDNEIIAVGEALAAPPDGTAPERRRDLPPGWRYAHGDRIDQGACERIADGKRAVDEHAAWEVERKYPHGTAPERARCQAMLFSHQCVLTRHGDETLHDVGPGYGGPLPDGWVARPPDGMPGARAAEYHSPEYDAMPTSPGADGMPGEPWDAIVLRGLAKLNWHTQDEQGRPYATIDEMFAGIPQDETHELAEDIDRVIEALSPDRPGEPARDEVMVVPTPKAEFALKAAGMWDEATMGAPPTVPGELPPDWPLRRAKIHQTLEVIRVECGTLRLSTAEIGALIDECIGALGYDAQPLSTPTVPGEPATINGPVCPSCGWANNTIRKRCRNCNADLVQHPDPDIDHEVRWDAEDGRRVEQAAHRAAPPTVPGEPDDEVDEGAWTCRCGALNGSGMTCCCKCDAPAPPTVPGEPLRRDPLEGIVRECHEELLALVGHDHAALFIEGRCRRIAERLADVAERLQFRAKHSRIGNG